MVESDQSVLEREKEQTFSVVVAIIGRFRIFQLRPVSFLPSSAAAVIVLGIMYLLERINYGWLRGGRTTHTSSSFFPIKSGLISSNHTQVHMYM